jgi:hypothetical protein
MRRRTTKRAKEDLGGAQAHDRTLLPLQQRQSTSVSHRPQRRQSPCRSFCLRIGSAAAWTAKKTAPDAGTKGYTMVSDEEEDDEEGEGVGGR